MLYDNSLSDFRDKIKEECVVAEADMGKSVKIFNSYLLRYIPSVQVVQSSSS